MTEASLPTLVSGGFKALPQILNIIRQRTAEARRCHRIGVLIGEGRLSLETINAPTSHVECCCESVLPEQ